MNRFLVAFFSEHNLDRRKSAIESIPDVADRAALDYAEMVPASPSYGPN